MWKSKLNWFVLGDENSGFFHRFVNAKKRKNLITELVDEQGVITKSFCDIERVILGFYEGLYKLGDIFYGQISLGL